MNTGAKVLGVHLPVAEIIWARSLVHLVFVFVFTALSRVPLADVTAISFTAPFVVAGLAGPLLHERVGTGQWLTIAVGFLGALVIILAALAGYIVFGDVPSVWTWAGAAIIIGSGLHIVWRETSR